MTTIEILQQERPPIPAVLLIGDFEGDGKVFVDPAFKLLADAYKKSPPGDAAAPSAHYKAWQEYTTNLNRSEGPALIPVPYSDGGHANRETFTEELLGLLSRYDVWAVIACGTASNTESLLEALEPVDVPILVVVDSTVNVLSSPYDNILRLTPNNELQAAAILAKAKELFAAHFAHEHGVFELFYQPVDNPYVKDLLETLRRLTEESSTQISPTEATGTKKLRTRRDVGVVVCIGYLDALQSLWHADILDRSHVILSDGCYNEKVLEMVTKWERNRVNFYWTHAQFSYAEYARDGYLAVTRTWQNLVKSGARYASPRSLRRPFLTIVKEYLEEQMPSRYKFNGGENQRGGYSVDKVSEATFSWPGADGTGVERNDK